MTARFATNRKNTSQALTPIAWLSMTLKRPRISRDFPHFPSQSHQLVTKTTWCSNILIVI